MVSRLCRKQDIFAGSTPASLTVRMVIMLMFHATTIEKLDLIKQEGILWGIRKVKDFNPSRCTYLADSVENAKKYGLIVLAVEFDPKKDVPNNYCDGCWQCRVYSPILFSQCKVMED